MRVASSAATLKMKTARSTSMRASLMGLPASCDRVRENSSRHSASGAESLDSRGDRSFGMLAPGLDHSPNYAAIERGADLDDVAIFHPAAVDEKPVGCDWGKRHFRHFCLPYADSDFDYRPWGLVAFLLATRILNTGDTGSHWVRPSVQLQWALLSNGCFGNYR